MLMSCFSPPLYSGVTPIKAEGHSGMTLPYLKKFRKGNAIPEI